MILSICEDPKILEIVRLVKIFINVITISVPIILIFVLMIKFAGAVTKSDDDGLKKVMKIAPKNILAAALIFLVPIFVRIVVKITAPSSDFTQCLDNSSSETIQEIAYESVKEKIQVLKTNLQETYYDSIMKDLKYLSSSEKEKVLEELEYIEKYIGTMNEIKSLTKKDKKKYEELLTLISKVEDATIKETLTKEIEKYASLFASEDPIKPQDDENIIKSEETDTLKVYIVGKNGYYLTRIWAEDPYNQLNKQDANPYGRTLKRPLELLNNAVSENNLSNKLIIGFNASGFYLKDTFDASSVNYYPAYDRTSVGTIVITNGKVVRNAYDKWYKTWFISGIDKNNNFRIFTDEKMDLNAKKGWANSVISSGIRNTFTFASPLVTDGKASSVTTSMPGGNSKLNRQAFCQIDNNNFLLITGSNLNRQDLINIMLSNNCMTGTNFDGGGSIALLFKSKNSTTIETITGGGRSLTEVGYFTE